MKSRHVVAKTFRASSVFDNIPLPNAALFGEPSVTSVLRARAGRTPRFFLIHQPPRPPVASRPHGHGDIFARRMLNYVQIATTPTADTLGTSLLLHFDDQRYVFGHIAEGTQRALVQRKLAVSRVENLFLSGPVNWRNAGGLLGLVLTVADSLKEQSDQFAAENKRKKKKPGQASPLSCLNIHAGKNLSHLLATARRFVFRKGLPLHPHEIRVDPRAAESATTSEPDWKDANINVWYMTLGADQKELATVNHRKRSHDEFNENPVTTSLTSHQDDSSQKMAEAVVMQMFDSTWTADALIETTLHQAKLPAKLFVRNEKGHLQEYTGPMPGSGGHVPDVPVLVRQPWPGATIAELPRTEPSTQSMCYIVKGHDRRGKFDPQAAERLGVAKKDYRYLTQGEAVKGKDGIEVTPEMVLGKTVTGSGFAVIDLPDVSYIDSLVNRPEWADSQIMQGVYVIFWILGDHVASDTRLQDFMQKMSSLKHIVTSADTCPNMIALESVAAQAYKLRCIDSDRFPLPVHSNKLPVSGAAATTPSACEIGRLGQVVQFAPQYMHQDDKIVPFPHIEKLALADLTEDVLGMAAQAKTRISDPVFIANVEKAEADIPNRDAEIISLGTGSAMPSKYRNVSATLVRVPGYGNYLFDAGENTLGQLRRVFGNESPSVLRDLKVIWISHLHADHHLGTASVIKAWHEETTKSNPSTKLIIASHGHMIDWVQEYADVENFGLDRLVLTRLNAHQSKTRLCEPRVFSTKETEQFGLAKIDAVGVNHCFGALATVFTFPSGLKIAYSGDCRPSDPFIQIGQGATILIHESTFDDELRGDAIAKKHSTMSEAIDVGRRMGARRILLTHFSQRYQKIPILEEDFEIHPDVRAEDKAKVDEVILVAFDYMRVKLGEFRNAQAFLPAIQKLLEKAEQ
ncbi:beta-lactamase-like protein [Xylaria telfairii]|nr:beta-lactamase-like protein [Xylaria telfairii]